MSIPSELDKKIVQEKNRLKYTIYEAFESQKKGWCGKMLVDYPSLRKEPHKSPCHFGHKEICLLQLENVTWAWVCRRCGRVQLRSIHGIEYTNGELGFIDINDTRSKVTLG